MPINNTQFSPQLFVFTHCRLCLVLPFFIKISSKNLSLCCLFQLPGSQNNGYSHPPVTTSKPLHGVNKPEAFFPPQLFYIISIEIYVILSLIG